MSISPAIQVLLQTTRIQLKLLAKSWGARLIDLFMPAAVAFVPILLAQAVAGNQASFNFAQYTGVTNFAGFLLIGGGAFMLVTRALWGFGAWLRQEMQSGVLESLYLSSAAMPFILAGVSLAFIIYSALIFIGAMAVGALLFQVVFQTNQFLLALAFLGVGLPAVYALALLYGALVLGLKETDAFIQIAQWLITLLMGVYFPITIFPAALKIMSLLFPPTWLTQGLRSALLGLPYFTSHWSSDLGVLTLFSILTPILAYTIFTRVEQGLRKGSGLGKF